MFLIPKHVVCAIVSEIFRIRLSSHKSMAQTKTGRDAGFPSGNAPDNPNKTMDVRSLRLPPPHPLPTPPLPPVVVRRHGPCPISPIPDGRHFATETSMKSS